MKSRIKPELSATVGQWAYICCQCLIQFETGSGVTCSGPECMACGNANMRYEHVLENMEDGRQIIVGIDCARALVAAEDEDLPRLAEAETKRKERWRVRYGKPGRCVTDVQGLEKRGKL
jgi:hypothetical protein